MRRIISGDSLEQHIVISNGKYEDNDFMVILMEQTGNMFAW